MMKNWTFGKTLTVAAFVKSFFLLCVGVAGYWAIGLLNSTSHSASQTHVAIEKMTECLSTFKDAETGQRGYLLTGDPTYLEPYEAAVQAVPHVIAELRAQTADDANQTHRVDQLETLANAKLAELRHTIDLRKAGHSDEALKAVQSNEGKVYMDNIRKLIEQMEQEGHAQLDKRAAEVEAAGNSAKAAILACTVVCLLLLIATAAFTTRSLGAQLGSAVGQVQSSSAELQAAATQQAAGAKQQASAMSEISTTISDRSSAPKSGITRRIGL